MEKARAVDNVPDEPRHERDGPLGKPPSDDQNGITFAEYFNFFAQLKRPLNEPRDVPLDDLDEPKMEKKKRFEEKMGAEERAEKRMEYIRSTTAAVGLLRTVELIFRFSFFLFEFACVQVIYRMRFLHIYANR